MSNKRKATGARDWKSKNKETWRAIATDLPSGNTALLRRAGLEQFLMMGMIPNTLIGLMQEQIAKAKGKPEALNEDDISEQLAEMLEDPQQLVDLIDMVDRITVFCVLEPKVAEVPVSHSDREEGTLYVDEVDLEDKMFIFQWAVGGVEDIEPFRKELAESLGSVLPGAEVGSSPE